MKYLRAIYYLIFTPTFEHNLLPKVKVMNKAAYCSGHDMHILQYLGLGQWRFVESVKDSEELRAKYPPFRTFKNMQIHL